MKKLFYVIAFSFVAAVSLSACSDEEVTPAVGGGENGGGEAIERIR
jgi:hypothetical protein